MAIILHIDLDAFFASCEKKRDPDLEGRGVVVCIYSDRGGDSGAVSAADYVAREDGIHAGMPIVQAKHFASDDTVFLPADKAFYSEMSQRVMEIIAEQVDDIEVASIDEAYGDVSSLSGYDDAEQVAERIKERIRAEGLTASIGIGPNKLVAKIASDLDKPDGLTVVPPDAVDATLADLDIEEIPGIGPKTADILREWGVNTINELRDVGVQRMIQEFGEKKGISLHEKAHGTGSTRLEASEKKQLSRITTLEQDTRDMAVLRPVIRELARDVMDRVEQRGWRYTRVSAILVTAERETKSRSRTLKAATNSFQPLYETAEQLVQQFLDEAPDTELRRIGVRAAGFEKSGQETLDVFS